MKQKRLAAVNGPTRLHSELQAAILAVIENDALQPGTRLGEVWLASRLQVSRTPVRAALDHLGRRGLVQRGRRGGYFVGKKVLSVRKPVVRLVSSNADRLFLAIARDRRVGKVPEEVSEGDLMRRYAVTRATVQQVLVKLSEVAAVQKKPGHGWRFLPSISDPKARAESYRLRAIVEPAALLEPDYQLEPDWIESMRLRHFEMLTNSWNDTMSIDLYEMNAQFHEGLVAGAHNRYLLLAVQQQNRLRRFANYDWKFGHERVVISCNEHLEILNYVEAGDRHAAAALMRKHLDAAAKLSVFNNLSTVSNPQRKAL